jgi:hypothetical protein
METQQMMEFLLARMNANKTRMEADRKAYREETMAILNAHHERMMACLGKKEAESEKTEPDPGNEAVHR